MRPHPTDIVFVDPSENFLVSHSGNRFLFEWSFSFELIKCLGTIYIKLCRRKTEISEFPRQTCVFSHHSIENHWFESRGFLYYGSVKIESRDDSFSRRIFTTVVMTFRLSGTFETVPFFME